MQQISKSKLKATMLQVFREIEASGETLVVTDHGKPVLKVEPIVRKKSIFEVFELYQDSWSLPDSILEPVWDEWEGYL